MLDADEIEIMREALETFIRTDIVLGIMGYIDDENEDL